MHVETGCAYSGILWWDQQQADSMMQLPSCLHIIMGLSDCQTVFRMCVCFESWECVVCGRVAVWPIARIFGGHKYGVLGPLDPWDPGIMDRCNKVGGQRWCRIPDARSEHVRLPKQPG